MCKKMSFFEFCERLKRDGAYIGADGHVYRSDGRSLSRKCRNGYYLLRKRYDSQTYHFCEHRVIWYFYNGEFDESLTINHKDFDRTNNKIENLELVTLRENLKYTRDAGRNNVARAEDSGKALFSNKEVQALRYLHEHGWSKKQLANMFDIKWGVTLNRILNGARYGSVTDAGDIVALYPIIVDRTWNKNLSKDDRIHNAIYGLNGELGELVDLLKKGFFHGHDVDMVHVALELGDVLYYFCALCNELEIDFAEVCYENMEKLYNRYPDGFEIERSLHRAEGDV